MAATHYLANRLLNHVLGIAPFTPPHPLYLALGTQLTAEPDGTWPDELQGKGYRRVPLCRVKYQPALMNWGVVNAHWIRFPTATEDWGDLPCYAIYDAPEGGNMYLFGSTYDADSTDFRYPFCGAGNWLSMPPNSLQIGYWSAEDTDAEPDVYALGAWIGQKVLELIFHASPFTISSLWARFQPAPGAGYHDVDVTGQFSAVSTGNVEGVSVNVEDFDFGLALENWFRSELFITDGDGHCLFAADWGPSAFVPAGDHGLVPAEAIQLEASAPTE
jgi:hypothetical protein